MSALRQETRHLPYDQRFDIAECVGYDCVSVTQRHRGDIDLAIPVTD